MRCLCDTAVAGNAQAFFFQPYFAASQYFRRAARKQLRDSVFNNFIQRKFLS
jgi:hypothetical protein